MAKRTFRAASWTPAAQADGVLTGTYMALKGGSSTQVNNITQIWEGGQSLTSATNAMCLAYSSTLGITPTALALPNSDGPMSGATAALSAPPVSYVAAATAPNRSPAVTLPRLDLSFNSLGGVVKWDAPPGYEWSMVGNAVNGGETVLSAINAAGSTPGLMGAHIIYETL